MHMNILKTSSRAEIEIRTIDTTYIVLIGKKRQKHVTSETRTQFTVVACKTSTKPSTYVKYVIKLVGAQILL
jgi:hypothetical protein